MKKKKEGLPVSHSFFDRADGFLGKHYNIWFWILFGVTLLISILLYDPRVSAGGDDSSYILSAHNFLKGFKYPGYQGPLYPIMLSLIDAIFGMSIPAFKVFSMVAMMACMFCMFRAFRKRIPPTLLFITLLLTSVNSQVLYFASQTYSEALYMFMQALLLFVFFRLFIDRDGQGVLPVVGEIKRHLILAITLFGVVLTRNIGYSILLAIVGYFIINKQWKNIGYFIVGFAICFGAYQLLRYALWDDVQISGQGSSLMNKDFYKPEHGRENLAGFINRFGINSNQYISRFFMAVLGLRDDITSEGIFAEVQPVITIVVYLLGLAGIWFSYRHNKYILFSGIVSGLFLIVTFVILQTQWNQIRLIIPVYPLMILLLFTAMYYLLCLRRLHSYQFLIIIPVVILLISALSDTSKDIKAAQKIKTEFSGLTPDWLNYAKASAWVSGNLPEEALVACRKPEISTIYAKGKNFYGIRKVQSSSFDGFIKHWEQDNKEYALYHTSGITNDLYSFLVHYYEARALIGETYYLVVNYTDDFKQGITQWPNTKAYTSSEELKPLLKKAENKASIYYADSLLAPLRDNHVTHILTANLRLNPYRKDGQIINTVERTSMFIQEKYPNIFTLTKRFGNQEDEPADIIQINWEVVGKK